MEGKEIYDDLVSGYSAYSNTNPFKEKYEVLEVLKEIGDIKGLKVLDLACGSGHYTRKLKDMGASDAVGVDISEEMIKDARRIELDQPLGIHYYIDDASKFVHDHEFDLVTAQYLFCYADSERKLLDFCENINKNTKPGGKFVSVTTFLDDTCKMENMSLGYKFVPCFMGDQKTTLDDGRKVDVTLYSGDLKSKCCFPNFLWKSETIGSLLQSTGFCSIKFRPIGPSVPVTMITATKGL